MPSITNAFTDGDALDSGNEALTTQAFRLAERRKQLQEQAAAIAQQGQPQGQMVSGRFVAPSKGQQLLPILGQALVQYKQTALDNEASDYERRAAAAAMEHLSHPPAADAPREEKLAWAQRGSQIPNVAPLMKAYATDQLVTEPERVEARAERRQKQADAIAEAQRKQQEELTYRRERDQQRADDNAANRDLRATLAHAVRSAGGGGDKASNYQLFQGDGGTITRVNKLSGQKDVVGQGGKSSAGVLKEQQDAKQAIDNAEKAIDLLDQMKPLIPKATSSTVGSVRDKALGVVGVSTAAGDAAGEIDQMGKKLVSYIDRKGLGPQFSDADLKFLSATSGGLGDPTIPVSRKLAVYERVRKQFEQQAKGPSIRDAVKAAADQHSTPKNIDDLLNKYR
ncbi:hypothetical protein QTH97_02280 [Variovorax sp. J22R24]|uniref:hypothetical protein n=1 Tax=Variovorax gracilis TaxID=3053502 RepID=UPI002574ADBE|nr:hypothetical protein [Variovorax sp. J22R24]MDM0103744.1 hypothetical protein [Variovorax sp. J22R24]